jgi:hypothetical protein
MLSIATAVWDSKFGFTAIPCNKRMSWDKRESTNIEFGLRGLFDISVPP